MKIIIDSREQKYKHITAWFAENKIDWDIKKLNVGDYQIEGNPHISIDRKQDLNELSRNLTNPKDHSRFLKEIRRSKLHNIKLIILCEHGNGIKSISDIYNWKDRYRNMPGSKLAQKIYKINVAYNIDFVFCEKSKTGENIIKILQNL